MISSLLAYFGIGAVFSSTMDTLDYVFKEGDAFSNRDRFKMIAAWPLIWAFIILEYLERRKLK